MLTQAISYEATTLLALPNSFAVGTSDGSVCMELFGSVNIKDPRGHTRRFLDFRLLRGSFSMLLSRQQDQCLGTLSGRRGALHGRHERQDLPLPGALQDLELLLSARQG